MHEGVEVLHALKDIKARQTKNSKKWLGALRVKYFGQHWRSNKLSLPHGHTKLVNHVGFKITKYATASM